MLKRKEVACRVVLRGDVQSLWPALISWLFMRRDC